MDVFRYLETTRLLAPYLSWITHTEQGQAKLIYWSYSQKEKDRWPPLNKARIEFGENLQRSSEPVLLAVSDKSLFFIEAKLTAKNETIPSNKQNRLKYLSGGNEWWKKVFVSDYKTAAIRARNMSCSGSGC